MSKQYINVNGVNLHYISKGQGDLMLFLHGFPDFSHIWRHQIDEFSNDFHTVALDLRGYNLSEKPSGLESYEIDVLVTGEQESAGHSLIATRNMYKN
ncbi:alpha/beta fold hydrolase [Priestia megaterium]|uniref:alpha/beta fold hydrolase n=1 Tax=Priestia megaterium TaxID=1404 RepID=UPI0033925254